MQNPLYGSMIFNTVGFASVDVPVALIIYFFRYVALTHCLAEIRLFLFFF